MRYTITYTRKLVVEETIEAPTLQEAEQYAEMRELDDALIESGLISNDTEFEIEEDDE